MWGGYSIRLRISYSLVLKVFTCSGPQSCMAQGLRKSAIIHRASKLD